MEKKSYEEIKKMRDPMDPKPQKFDVGDQLIVTIGAVSRPGADTGEEVDYLFVGAKADEWVGEDTLTKAIPLEKGEANFVSGYKAGWKEGWEAAQAKDREYFMQFILDMQGPREDLSEMEAGNGTNQPS